MKELVNLAKELNESDKCMTDEDYRMIADNISNFSEEDQKEIAHILLIEVVSCPNKLTLNDFKNFKKILGENKLASYICDAMEFFGFENYGKKPIFQDSELVNAIYNMYSGIKRCEYLTIMAMLNNGFGDKSTLKSYIETVNYKVFNYSNKWKALYRKAVDYIYNK